MPPGTTPMATDFRPVARLLRDHAHIVRIYGYGDQPPAMVMERPQADLGTLLQSDIALSLHTRLDVCQQWASGLEAMHANGVAHCDLKPANVLVSQSPDGASWRVALGDLGTSRNLNPDRASALVAGAPELNAMTARYAAPEVIAAFRRKRPLDTGALLPAGVYSAALLLWECLSRTAPWQGCSFEQITESVVRGDRPDVQAAAAPIAQASAPLAQTLLDVLPRLWCPEPRGRPPAASLRQQVATLAAMLPAGGWRPLFMHAPSPMPDPGERARRGAGGKGH
ncbi:serine/threonine protein kinase [Fonticula alba]|uniref:Serine/threonine protein kinase n=1 Tax=Fonticula alba TaxID=691883 RepID=A0A058Z1P1_FONAL|nr:serine/threonine protein kinase [Fonticula alba]KCV67427.1 serine/threonine protein kinase [Fonticula alba]|eukprot:XP_009498154.1 serine/threonine protein kinase [Fonticula alba]